MREGIEIITAVEAEHRSALEAIGWDVQSDTQADGVYLSLRRKTHIGTPVKHPTIVLGFEPMTWDVQVVRGAGGTERTNIRPRARPWSVRSRPGGQHGTWNTPAKAVEVFLAEAATYP